ncbi:MAG: hypothetical protein HC811_01045, partial [Flammeovirgaceae bacterium]|nr:hypothetical protein [Flammeovirgaceae bacterium]
MKRLVIVLLVSSLVFFTGYSQNYTALNGPYGGSPSKIVSTGSALISIVYSAGVFKSTDGGGTWTPSNTGLGTDLYPNDLIRHAATGKLYYLTSNKLYTSTNDGANWTLTANSGFSSARFIRKTTSFVFIISGNSQVYRSSNDGTSWSLVNSFSGFPRDFAVNTSGHFYIATDGNGVYRSTNNGLNLDQLDSGEGLSNPNIYSVYTNGATIYALSSSGLFKSTNNGDSWTVSMGTAPTEITDCCFGWQSKIVADPSANIYVINGLLIWKSTNAGASWTSFNSPVPSGLYGDIESIYFESSSVIYAGIREVGLYKSIDGGSSWFSVNEGITGLYPRDLEITNNGRLLYAKGWPWGFYMSIDDGATWDFLATGTTARSVDGFLKIGSTVFGHGSGIIKTIDNGSNWTEVEQGNYYFESLLSNDGISMFSPTYDYSASPPVYAINRSNDSGVTWSLQQITGMPSLDCSYYSSIERTILGSGGNVFASVYEYCSQNKILLFKIDPATGAATEITSFPAGNIADVGYFNNKLYVFTSNSKLHISSDAGQTWTTKNTTTGNGTLKIISDNTFYILNTSVFLSNDGGTTWTNTGSPDGNNKYNVDILLSSANYSYVAQDRGKTYRSNLQVVPPTAPSNLSAFYFDRNSIGVIFDDNSTTETGFVIELAEGASSVFDSVAWTTRPASYARNQATALVYLTKNGVALSSNTLYKIRVRASGSGGKSTPSNEITVTTAQDCSATSDVPDNRSWTATTQNISGVGVMTKLNQVVSGSNGFYSIEDLPIGASTGLSPVPPDPYGVGFEENCGVVSMSSTFDYIANGNGTWDSGTGTITIPWITHPQYPYREETTVYTLNLVDPAPGTPASLTVIPFLPNTTLLNWSTSFFATEYELER